MTEKTLHLKKSDLTGFEELLLITGSDPMKFLYVGYRPDTGFEGGLLENPKRDPLADCAAEIDRAAAKGAAPAFRPIKDGLPYSIL